MMKGGKEGISRPHLWQRPPFIEERLANDWSPLRVIIMCVARSCLLRTCYDRRVI